jgi:chromate transporter
MTIVTSDILETGGARAKDHGIPFGAAVKVWMRIASLSFGGPAGQIAVMHRILVDEKRWIGEERFLHALNYCMLLPGPEAQQLAAYIGWLLHKTKGGLVAGALFVLPGFVAILALSFLYVLLGQAPCPYAPLRRRRIGLWKQTMSTCLGKPVPRCLPSISCQ